LLSYDGEYIDDDDTDIADLNLKHFDTMTIEDRGFMIPVIMADVLAYLGPLVTLWFIGDTTADLKSRRPSWHYYLYETIFEPEVSQQTHGANVLFVEPEWLRTINWCVHI
jgi:hypothetical protein